jgi:hypothetical protein
VLLIFVVLEKVKGLLFGQAQPLKFQLRLDDLLDVFLKFFVIGLGHFRISTEIIKKALVSGWTVRQLSILVIHLNGVSEYVGT